MFEDYIKFGALITPMDVVGHGMKIYIKHMMEEKHVSILTSSQQKDLT